MKTWKTEDLLVLPHPDYEAGRICLSRDWMLRQLQYVENEIRWRMKPLQKGSTSYRDRWQLLIRLEDLKRDIKRFIGESEPSDSLEDVGSNLESEPAGLPRFVGQFIGSA